MSSYYIEAVVIFCCLLVLYSIFSVLSSDVGTLLKYCNLGLDAAACSSSLPVSLIRNSSFSTSVAASWKHCRAWRGQRKCDDCTDHVVLPRRVDPWGCCDSPSDPPRWPDNTEPAWSDRSRCSPDTRDQSASRTPAHTDNTSCWVTTVTSYMKATL